MKKIGSVLFLILFLFTISRAQDSLSRPIIKFDQTVYDFGLVNGDTTLVHIFKFKNLGKQTLKIKGIRPG